jgi:hypothetical protein
MTFSIADYQDALADYEARWCAIDQELYDLCRRYPDHKDPRGTNAKLWIIGRTYATGIERKITTTGTQGSSLTQLSDYLLSRARRLDRILHGLKNVREPLTTEKLRFAVHSHGQFLQMLKGITREEQAARSFASKYLHFHNPTVPIIDTYVAGIMPKLVRWRPALSVLKVPRHADYCYTRYTMRFWSLYETATKAVQRVSVKHLDYYLMWLSGST